jgi:DNA-binding MarR family transcriptional regulator
VTSHTQPDQPLARLLAIAFRSMIDGLHEQLSQRGWTDVRPAYGFVLLAARHDTTTATEIAVLMGTSKQAASKLVDGMVAAGYLDRLPAGDARQRPVGLSERGHQLLAVVEEIYRQIEGDWAEVIGQRSVERLRRDLTRVLSRHHGGRLPPVRPAS